MATAPFRAGQLRSAIGPRLGAMGGLRDALTKLGSAQMRSKSQTAWERPPDAQCLPEEKHMIKKNARITSELRDAWTTLAKRCEDFNITDVAEK